MGEQLVARRSDPPLTQGTLPWGLSRLPEPASGSGEGSEARAKSPGKGNEDSTIYFFSDFQRAAQQVSDEIAVIRKLVVRKDTDLQRRVAQVSTAMDLEKEERERYIDNFFEDAKKNVVRKANRLHEDVDLFRMMQGVDDQTQHSNLVHTEREIHRLGAGLCMVAEDWNMAVRGMNIPAELDPSRTGKSPPPNM